MAGAFLGDRVRDFVTGTGRGLGGPRDDGDADLGQIFRTFEPDARVHERIGNLVAYIQSMQLPSTGQDDTGSRLFRTYCASCHGTKGRESRN